MGQTFDDLIGRIADGHPVDWSAASAQARDAADRELLEQLRLIARVTDTHKSGDLPRGVDVTSDLDLDGAVDGEAPPVGSRWGRYSLVNSVGAGGFGAVFRARDEDLNRDIAIKLLHAGVSDHDDFGSRVLHEARALAKVKHGNVVMVHGVERHAGRTGLCMEFIDGQTLDARVRLDGPLNADEAIVIGLAVAQGLSALHHTGLLHRDVKAKNVMRERAGRIVLMDLGAGLDMHDARRLAASSSTGTPLCMAPELFSGVSASVHSDIYSVGVLLYFLVTGRHPVEGDSLDAIRRAHADGRHTPLASRRPDLPLPFVRIVERALQRAPLQRFNTANALVQALAEQRLDPLPPAPVRPPLVTVSRVLTVAAILVVLGGINSRYFNVTLGRSDHTDEGIADWFLFGLQSIVAPLAVAALGTSATSLALALRPLVLAAWAPARRFDAALIARLQHWHLDNVLAASACALVVATAILAGTWWLCLPTLEALMSIPIGVSVSTAPAHTLAFLGPEHLNENIDYRWRLAWCTFAVAAVWYPVERLAARQGQSIHRGLALGGVAIFTLSLVLLDFPYRLMVLNKFPAITWGGEDCHVIGRRDDELLIFCPTMLPPRNQIVSASSPDLRRKGTTDGIFTRIREAK